MPNGPRKGKTRAAALRLDPEEIQEEIRRNRESNERFLRDYSAWFERRGRSPKRKRN